MIKYLILFLFIINCGCHGQLSSCSDYYNEVGEYYYNILLNDLLKNVDWQELTPTPIMSTEWKSVATGWQTYMKNREPDSVIITLLNERYNMNLKRHDIYITRGSMGYEYGYWLFLVRGLPKKEHAWFLFSVKSKRYAWLKEKIEMPEWKMVNQSEIRDNNTYTFLLKKKNFDGVYQCSSPQKFNKLDDNENVDSVGALTIAVATATNYYGVAVTPIAARPMGDNKEHWLVYCFSTIQDNVKLQDICYKTAINRYNDGLNLWNWPFNYISNDSIGHSSEIISILISKKTGQVLFMERTGNNCPYRHDGEGRHIGESPPLSAPDYLR